MGAGLLIASGVQGGHAPAPGDETLVVGVLIVAMVLACVPIVAYLRRHARRLPPVADQWQALAVMGELCPHGWKAQITVYGWNAPIPADAPPSRTPLIGVQWSQFEQEDGELAVARRVWAPNIGEALQMMAEDRRIDIALERIEREASGKEVEGSTGSL